MASPNGEKRRLRQTMEREERQRRRDECANKGATECVDVDVAEKREMRSRSKEDTPKNMNMKFDKLQGILR